MMKKAIFVISLILITSISCSDSEESLYEDSVCDQITEVNNNKYKSIQTSGVIIRDVQLTGDCLRIEIESGGCSGDTWKVDLIDGGRVAESTPEQRDLKISLINNELCNALVTRTYTFDLRPIRTNNDVVLLNLDLWEEQIRYEY